MSDRAPLLRAVHKARSIKIGRTTKLELTLACGHSTLRFHHQPTISSAHCPSCELIRYDQLHTEPLPQLRLTHYGL